MKPSSLPMELPSSARPYLGMVIFASAFVFALPIEGPVKWLNEGSEGLSSNQFFDLPSIVVMCLTTILPTASLWWTAKVPPGKVLLVLSVPAGIMICTAGMHTLLHLGDGESYSVGGNSAVMVLTVLYSTVITFFGYMLDQQDKGYFGTMPLKHIILPFLLTALTLYSIAATVAELNSSEVTAFFSEEIFILFIGIFAALTLRNDNRGIASSLADASIIGIIISIVITLVTWFASLPSSDVPRNATEFATLAMLYGTVFYIMSFYLSHVTGEVNKINFGLKNWHLIELAALYFLLVFAPPSIFEIAT